MAYPSSLSTSLPEEIPTSTPRTTSLAAAAAVNAGLQRESSNEESISRRGSMRSPQAPSPNLQPRSSIERQRNSVAMSLNLNDPALPSAGELQGTSPSHGRASARPFQSPSTRNAESRSRSSSVANRQRGRQPSVGEVYQEMEQEQEAQVNRLLQTIRHQQNQIQALMNKSDSADEEGHTSGNLLAASNGDLPLLHSPVATPDRARRQSQTSLAPVRSIPTGYQLSHALSSDQELAILRSGQNTPALPTPASSVSGAARDEVAFYQAEVQNLNRENQRLRAEIRELASRISDMQSANPELTQKFGETRLSEQ